MQEQIDAKIIEARELIEANKLDEAKALMVEIDELKAALVEKEELLKALDQEEREEVAEEETVPEEETETVATTHDEEEDKKNHAEQRSAQKGEVTNMKQITNPLNEGTEQRSAFEAFLRSKGTEKREGLKVIDAGAVIPTEVLLNPQDQVNSVVELKELANRIPVSTGSGTYPVLKSTNDVLPSVAELEKNPALAKPEFISVKWDVATHRGFIPISEEAFQDAGIDLSALVAKHIKRQAVATSNAAIAAEMKKFTAVAATTLDDIKKVVNVDLDPGYNVKFVVSQSFYQAVDTLKDANGRYILEQNINFKSGLSLFGREIVIVRDEVLGAAGEAKAFVGDIERGILFADRADVAVKWQDHDVYGRMLSSALRFDAKVADPEAGRFVTLTIA